MTLPIERARTRRPVTWVTILGVILLPVLIGGLLVAALYNPAERLENMSAAIVNDDEPVEIDGQLAPLGRQLTAGLVEGSDEVPSNLDWVISNDSDAAAGLADGTYDAVITIPQDFSRAATSTAPGGDPQKAVIEVTTSPDSLIVDDAITAQITQAAASVMGSQLSSVYLENVLLGFTTLGDQLGEVADGAQQLADGGRTAADGATDLADGVGQLAGGADGIAGGAGELAGGASQLAGGASQLADGVGQVAAGTNGIADGAAGLATGAGQLADGAGQLSNGAQAAATGLDEWAGGAQEIAANGRELAGGLQQIADGFTQNPFPEIPAEVVDAANAIQGDSADINAGLTQAAGVLAELAAACGTTPGAEQLCAQLSEASSAVDANLDTATGIVASAGTIVEGLNSLPALGTGLQELSTGLTQLSGGIDQLADGATAAAGGVGQLAGGAAELQGGAAALASGATQLASGAGELAGGASVAASGATDLAGGAAQLSGGAAQLSGGAVQLADGAGAAATGATDLAGGIGQLADGTGTLADGLDTATESIPSYTDAEASDLAAVVAAPVRADGLGSDLFGASAVPLLAALALWLGGIASFIALQAVPRDALSSRRPSVALALRAFAPAAVIGAVQGVLVAAVVQLAAEYDPATWVAFAGMSMLAGVAFAAVNQALLALFGGVGRWVAAGVAALSVATGIVSTVPGVLSDVAALLPTSPAYTGLLAALTPAGGGSAAIAALVIWTILSLVVTVIAVARTRTTNARAVLRPAGA